MGQHDYSSGVKPDAVGLSNKLATLRLEVLMSAPSSHCQDRYLPWGIAMVL